MKVVPLDIIRQYGVVMIVNLSVLSTGMNLAWPSPMLVKLADPELTPLPRPITDNEGSWIVSVGFLAGAVSNLGVGMLMDTIGRKYCILLAAVLKFFTGLLFIFATQVWMLILGRAIIIMVETMLFSAIPVYASEIANKKQRGALGTFLQIFTSLGMVVTLSVGPFTSYVTFNVILTCIVVITCVPLVLVPDSPYYLYSKGRVEEARKVLTYIRGSEDLVTEELNGYDKARESEKAINNLSKVALLKNNKFRKSLILGVMLGIGTQFIGFSAVTFYLQTILETTNVSIRSEIASVISGVMEFVGSACAAPIARNVGRKTILQWSLGGYFIGMVCLGVFFKITEPEDYVINGFLNYLPLLSLILVIFCYNVGIGALYFLIAAELYDDISRAFGFSIFLSITTFLTFFTTKYFISIKLLLGPAVTYWVLSGFTISHIIYITVFIPETKGKTFEEIQKALGYDDKNNKENCDNKA